MKRPIALLFTDPHLKPSNIREVDLLFLEAEKKTKELGIPRIIVLGDIFESRNAQPLAVLNTFGAILEKLTIEVIIIPGNHDKVDYKSENSYLDEYKFHPNVKIFRKYTSLHVENMKGLTFHFIPYFDEATTYSTYLKECLDNIKDLNKHYSEERHILFTHIAVNGVRNNDYNLVENELTTKLFSPFETVFVGHYHNKSDVGNNVLYIGSPYPTNFGEDNNKGFTILYDDGTIDFIRRDFVQFHTLEFNLDEIELDEVIQIAKEKQSSPHRYRFVFSGKESNLKALDKGIFLLYGIDVKFKNPKILNTIKEVSAQKFIKLDKTAILEKFDEFCKKNKLKKAIGLEFLNKQLNLKQ